jgi:hypothetical protein
MPKTIGSAMAIAIMLATGCTDPTDDARPSIAPDCVDMSADLTFSVELVDYAYHPPCVIVATESPFELSNTGEAIHTFTIDGQGIDIEIGPGETYRSEDGLDIRAGVYRVRCTLHPQMLGTIEVR